MSRPLSQLKRPRQLAPFEKDFDHSEDLVIAKISLVTIDVAVVCGTDIEDFAVRCADNP
jgi:hypothetical protein